jgi:hypothetical protein
MSKHEFRQRVYEAIDEERSYQEKWGGYEVDDKHDVWSWLSFMRRYLRKAEDQDTVCGALDNVRKVAALAVVCMEHEGIIRRGDANDSR